MTIRYGRADLADLSRKLRAGLADQRKRDAEPPPLRERIDAFVYPTGWNHLGQPVTWEATPIAEHRAGELVARGPSVEACKRRLRGALLDALVRTYHLSGTEARQRARDAVVTVTELPRRPGEGTQ